MTTDQEVGDSSSSGRAGEALAVGAVAWMVSGVGVSACSGGGASILVPGSGSCDSVSVDFEQVVDGADESPLA